MRTVFKYLIVSVLLAIPLVCAKPCAACWYDDELKPGEEWVKPVPLFDDDKWLLEPDPFCEDFSVTV